MFSRIFFAALLPLLTTMTVFSQTTPLETGVSQTLAKWRAANYSDVRYKLNITLEKGAPLMRGDIEVRVNLTDAGAKNDLILDWRTTQFQNDKDKPFANVIAVNEKSLLNSKESLYFVRDEHLIVDKSLLKTGENVIKIQFASPIKTSGAAITRYVDKEDGAEYVYSLLVPSDASTAFPVFDQPDLKARFWLDLVVPKDWGVISNTDIALSSFHPEYAEDTREVVLLDHTPTIFVPSGMRLHRFFETKPISTYLFSFAAGDFAEFTEGSNEPHPIPKSMDYRSDDPKWYMNYIRNHSRNYSKIYVRKSQAEKFKQHAAEVFRLNREGVKFLESWFDYKFPFPKYDLVLIPEFPFGGMEHAGCTFLREDRVIFPSEPTKNDYITRANVIFHEAAHQWFGDTVTMRWFDDLWLKEGFAEFMAYKTLEKVIPEYNAWKIFYERNKQLAYLTDSTRGTTPIYQEIPNLSAAKSAYGNIVYRKAPSFLRQAEFYLGEDKFQTAVRAFLKKHEFANAEWTDLVKEFETASGQDLRDWVENWVKESGLSKITVSTIKATGERNEKNTLIVFFQDDYWTMNTKALIQLSDGKRREELIKFKRGNRFEKGEGEQIPPSFPSLLLVKYANVKFIFPNYQDYGYGIFLLDEKSRAYVLENIQNEKDDFLRTMMWGSLWDSVRETELAPKDYVRLVIKNINIEIDESTIQTLLGRVSIAMNYYLSDAQRDALAPPLENLLFEKMKNSFSPGERTTYFRAFLNNASSLAARKALKDILKGERYVVRGTFTKIDTPATGGGAAYVPSLPVLRTKDKFDIVTRLLILNDKDAPQLLADLEKTETSDEAKRYAYAARAGIATAENKQKYFDDFLNKKEISESWIEAAFAPFNSIRHSDLTLPYLEKALAKLPNLKRNRKIFFVNGWLGAFIGGQKSEQALEIVNKFLADNPNLDKDLRLKILEASDGLERSLKIRQTFANREN